MPIIMEDTLNVDDLFGDPTSLELGIEAAPAVKGLHQRLDDLRISGCCQKIAWSRLGAIAYVSQDGQRLFIRYLFCNPEDGKWGLSGDTPVDQIVDAHAGHTIVHIQWNETGSELAVVYSSGSISIIVSLIALNAFTPSRRASTDADDDDGAQPIGLMWLNINRPLHAFHTATRVNGRWSYPPYRRRPLGPLHPANKSTLVVVTKSGNLKLHYQVRESKWTEISAELKNPGYSDGVLTHAAISPCISPEGPGILIATHSACGKLCIYRVHIKWDPPECDPKTKPNSAFPTPSFQVTNIKTETLSTVFHPPGHEVENLTGFSQANGAIYNLTHLEIIPVSPEGSGTQTPGHCIFVVSSVPVHSQVGQPPPPGPSSVLLRWQLDSTGQTLPLHSAFDEVTSKKTDSNPKPKMALRRQEDIYFDRFVVSIDYAEAGRVLAITYDDSSISFFDSRSMRPFSENEDVNVVTSMPDAGFSFPIDTSGLHIAFSPNGCLAVVIDGDWQLHLRHMEHSFGAEDGLYNDGKFTSAVAALALAFGRACCLESTTDDVLTIIMRQLTPDAQKSFILEAYTILLGQFDFTVEHDKLMGNTYIQKCLSMQAVLGFKSKYHERNINSAVPWVILNLRQISMLLGYSFHFGAKNGRESEPFEPDILRMVLGNVKWIFDFVQYLIDDIFQIVESLPTDRNSFSQSGKLYESLPLLILLSSPSRCFLRYIHMCLRRLPSFFNAIPNLSGESYHLCSIITNTIENSPALKLPVLDKLIKSIDAIVDQSYKAAGFSNGERSGPERELLITCTVPPVLQPAVMAILTEAMPAISGEVDRMALAMGDYSWLGVGGDKRTELFKRTHEVDIIKRAVIQGDTLGGGDGGGGGEKQPKRSFEDWGA
ncbi:mediator complex subunit [Emmonsiellopsis sp. PD_33]|nr:mediator complex subunit [Emmonsiellopsis sp. PD_33]